MKVLGSVLSILFLCIAVSGQRSGSISGTTVMDGKPVSVSVTIYSKNGVSRSTQSGQDGHYLFSDLPPGGYEVVAPNATVAVKQTVFIRSGQNGIVNLNLSVIRSSISENVTVAAGENQPIEAVSKTVDVITAQEMRDRSDFSLVDSLRTIPGFRVTQSGGFGRLATIKTRGLRNQDTALLIDGIRFRDPTAITGDASPFLSDLTLTSVSQIEVLRGSGSSLYGTNAIGGTIDLQTPIARQGTHGQIGGAYGGLGLGRFRGNVSHGTEDGRFGVTAGVSRTAYTKGIDGDDNAANTNLQTRIDVSPAIKTRISGRIFFSDANVRLNSSPDTTGPLPSSNATIIDARSGINFVSDANDPDNLQRSRFSDGQIVVDQVINTKVLVSGYYQGLTTRRNNTNGPLGVGFQSASTSIFDGTIHTGNIHFNWTPVKGNQLTIGYEFENERYGNDGKTPMGTGNFFTRAGQSSNTTYLQDLIRLLDGNLQFAGGVRVQQFSLDRPTFSLTNSPYNSIVLDNPPTAYTADGSASYFISKTGTKLRAHIGNGYRVPSLYERFGTFFSTYPSNNFVAIGDPFLKPEKTIAFDLGVEQYAARERVRLSATYFYTRLTDIIGYGNVAPNIGSTSRPYGGYINQKGGIARGGEFSVKAKATVSMDLFASYTFTNSGQLTPQVSGSGVLKTLGVPEHQFTLVATQRFNRAWVNFDFLATSSYLAPIFSNSSFNTYIYRFRGNRRGDLTSGYTFGLKREKLTVRLYGTIENVFDQEYFENGFNTAKRTGRVGLTFGF